MNMRILAAQAARTAALLRAQHHIGPAEGLCPYDLAIALQIKVHFMAAPSLEGMYSPEPRPVIILSPERPAGRRRFTCAHEIGHHVFQHGYRLDELNDENSSPASLEELLAQRFASALLMPKITVDAAFARRGWSSADAQSEQYFIVAQELGVGYTALVTNAAANLKTISAAQAAALCKIPLPKIRQGILGRPYAGDIFVVDEHWIRRTVDVEIGDLVILPRQAQFIGKCGSADGGNLLATAVGTGKITLRPGQAPLTLRVSKEGFVGLARYRHLEEDDEL
jgi:Zn-dependent peptidase ImmA (M78 family)